MKAALQNPDWVPSATYVDVGWCDIECEFILENLDELSKIMAEINSKFAGAIKKQAFWVTEEVHKDRSLPER